MCDKYSFSSAFAPMLSGFIREKQCLGYKYESEARCLQHFDRYCNDHCFPPVLSEDVVMGYVQPDPNRCKKTTLNRIGLLRQFTLYLHRNGHYAWLYPEELFPKKETVFHPYVFTNDEISRFMEAAKNIPYNKQHPYRHLVLPLLFRTLYCCGLRISEALNLKIRDVDLKEGVLLIRDAKDYRDRLIPLNGDLHTRYLRYYAEVLQGQTENFPFFPSTGGDCYRQAYIGVVYRKLLWECGISYGGRKKGPHLHSLRHTFSVHCLQKCISSGVDLQEILPVLSAYLGHRTFRGTQKYLHLTAELFPEILDVVEKHCAGIIPEVGAKDE